VTTGGDPLQSNVLGDLRASREGLLAAIAGVSEEQFKRRPPAAAEATAGAWSIAEALAHLLAAEQRRCARLEALLKGGSPSPEALTDDERTAEARLGRAVPVPQIIHGLLAARRRLERALTEASEQAPGETQRTEQGREGERTELKLRPYTWAEGAIELVRREIIAHEREHTAQIEAVKASLPPRGGGP
jgi:uncharacterized damage-inducible protein DinB